MTRLGTPWALALLPLAGAAVWWILRRRRTIDPRLAFPAAAMFDGIPASPWTRLEAALPWARGTVLALVVLALARPQAGAALTTVSSQGIDIVIALDISGSMRCEDTRPRSRLNVAKESIARFIAGRPSDRIGLVDFASAAGTRCPLTLDHEMLSQFMEQIDFAPPGEYRTALGMGLASAVNRLRASKAKSKLVVLVTDGRNNEGQVGPEAAADAAKALGVKVDTIGVGSENPVPCPVDDPQGGRHYMVVRSDLDMDLLQRLASATGGRAWRASDAKGLEQAFKDIDALEKTTMESRIRVLYSERFAGVLVAAGALLAVELLLAGTRLRRLP